jgi:excisionase family DNA binding protein
VSDRRYYTIEEFVEHLKQAGLAFSVRTVRHWIKTGKIKAYRPGERQWFIPVEEADKLLQGPATSETQLALRFVPAATGARTRRAM